MGLGFLNELSGAIYQKIEQSEEQKKKDPRLKCRLFLPHPFNSLISLIQESVRVAYKPRQKKLFVTFFKPTENTLLSLMHQ